MKAGIAIFVAMWGFGSPAGAATADATVVIDAVEAKYAGVEAMRASFTQTTHSEVFGDETQEGQVTLKRPAKMRWEFTSGDGKAFITDGKTMWVYTKADKQVIKYTDVSSASSAADSLLQSLDKLGEHFNVVLVDGAADSYTLDLTPKAESGSVKQLRLVLDQSYLLQNLTLVDSFDNKTELAFREVVLNADAADSLFGFVVPAGVEVIDAGSM